MEFSRRIFSGGPPNSSGYHLGAADKVISDASKPDDAVPHRYRKSYDDIKQNLLEKGDLFFDPYFPARDSSIYYSTPPPYEVEWKRPKDIVDNPQFIVDDASRFDVSQGALGDCWLLASIASLCNDPTLITNVIPHDQSFEEEYCGLFRFRFWQYGRWEEVIIDDRLPTYNGELIYMHSADNTEFWSPLLEKAYAKLCGSYEALSGGHTSEGMVDFTGGVSETYKLKGEQPDNLFQLMMHMQKTQSLMCAAINAKPGEIEFKLDNGLVMGHAYTISAVEELPNLGYQLLRVRNPWGNSYEWTGRWSDGSEEWDSLSDEEKESIHLSFQEDGEFWISFEDFCYNFDRVDICLLSPVAAGDESTKQWEMKLHQGTWQKYVSAGGCRNYPDTFHLNPQYRITLNCPDEQCPDEEECDDEKCTIVLGLMQKSRRKVRAIGGSNLTIGFALYKLEDDSEQYYENRRLNKDFFLYNKAIARSDTFINSREVTGRFSLPVGEYVVIPSTFDPNEEGDFILRMFSEQPQEASCLDTPTQIEISDAKPTEEENEEFDDKFKEYFEEIAGEDGEIDPFELQNVVGSIVKTEGRVFTIDACRSMLSMVDRDRNGRLSYDEFRVLWRNILEWEENFTKYQTNDDGDLLVTELRQALSHIGFRLNTPSLSSIALRWATKSGGISLEDYIQICCRVKAAFGSFLAFQGRSFSLNNYIMQAIYI